MACLRLAALTALVGLQLTSAQELVSDSGRSGPELELVHLYNDQWPTGITVSSTGRKFSNYPAGLDQNNTNDGSNGKYTVAELFDDKTEGPYPSAEMNHLQSVVIDSADRLWILDTGRVQTRHARGRPRPGQRRRRQAGRRRPRDRLGSRYLYSIPTERLRDNGPASEIRAQAAVVTRSQKGLADGFETASNGLIYHGNMEVNAINYFSPENGTSQVFLRDPRINWADTFSVAADGYLYFTNNQLAFGPANYPGPDTRQRPFSLFRAKLPNGGPKVGGGS